MKEQIQQKIVDWVRENSIRVYMADDECDDYVCDGEDLRTRSPQLAQEIVDMVVGEIKKEQKYYTFNALIPQMFANEEYLRALDYIIHILKK
jgi:glutaredoxin-related protein